MFFNTHHINIKFDIKDAKNKFMKVCNGGGLFYLYTFDSTVCGYILIQLLFMEKLHLIRQIMT